MSVVPSAAVRWWNSLTNMGQVTYRGLYHKQHGHMASEPDVADWAYNEEKDLPMRQLIDLDNYIEMIKHLGVEEAYKQRYRRTGRTVRDILRLTLALSEGKKIVMFTSSAPGHTLHYHKNVLDQVWQMCRVLNMEEEVQVFEACTRIVYRMSGGVLQVASNKEHFWRGRRDRDEYKEYALHDC